MDKEIAMSLAARVETAVASARRMQIVESDKKAAASIEPHHTVPGMDMVAAAESHVKLFNHMKDFLHGEIVDGAWAELIGKANLCDLGLWLENEGRKHFGHIPALANLREVHDEFHDHVESVLEMMHIGSWVNAENMRKHELSQSLRRVLIGLTDLNEAIRNQSSRV
jgi:hypothetical protein